MSKVRVALGIRAQLLLVLSVFLLIPWLGYEYVRELERFLRDAQERTLAGTAQAVATALHDRPRLFDVPSSPRETLAVERAQDTTTGGAAGTVAPRMDVPADGSGGGGPAEIAQIVQGLSRTTARIFVIDRELNVLARAGSLKRAPLPDEQAADSGVARTWQWLERETLHPLYALVLKQPSEDFGEDAGRVSLPAREVDGAMSGILTVDRRPTADGRAVVVSAAHPIWVGDQVKGAVVVEETTNAVLAERNRAFERLFSIVIAALLVGSLALTLFASRLSARIRRLRDQAEARDRRAGARSRRALGIERGRRDRRPVAQLFERALAPGAVRELSRKHGEPALARVAHADRGRAKLARQPEALNAAG